MKAIWLKIQLKRTFYALPVFLCAFIIFSIFAYFTGRIAYEGFENLVNPEKMSIAVVMPKNSELEDYMIKLLNDMQSVKDSIDLKVQSGDSAYRALDDGDAVAVIEIPEEFVRQIMDGKNKPALISVSAKRPIEGELIKELSESLAGILAKSQSYIYASADHLVSINASYEDRISLQNALNKVFIQTSLLREKLYSRNTVYSQSFDVKFVISMYILTVFVSSVGFVGFFAPNGNGLAKCLRRCGFNRLYMAILSLLGVFLAYALIGAAVVLMLRMPFSPYSLSLTESLILIWVTICVGVMASAMFLFSKRPELMIPYVFLTGFVLFFTAGGFIPDVFLPSALRNSPNPMSYVIDALTWAFMHRTEFVAFETLYILSAVSCIFYLTVYLAREVRICAS